MVRQEPPLCTLPSVLICTTKMEQHPPHHGRGIIAAQVTCLQRCVSHLCRFRGAGNRKWGIWNASVEPNKKILEAKILLSAMKERSQPISINSQDRQNDSSINIANVHLLTSHISLLGGGLDSSAGRECSLLKCTFSLLENWQLFSKSLWCSFA